MQQDNSNYTGHPVDAIIYDLNTQPELGRAWRFTDPQSKLEIREVWQEIIDIEVSGSQIAVLQRLLYLIESNKEEFPTTTSIKRLIRQWIRELSRGGGEVII